MPLRLDIVTPGGVALHYSGVERIVLRRAGSRSNPPGEIVMLPGSGRMTVPVPEHVLRVRAGDDVIHVEVRGGFVERHGDSVAVLTRAARVVAVDQVCVAAS